MGKVAPAGGARGNGAGAEPTTQCLDAANLARDILANARDGAQLTVVDAKAVRSCDVGQYLVAVRFGGHPTEDTGVWASGSLELGELGSTVREPTEDDGILSWQVVGPPVVAAATLLWWLLNGALRSRLAAEAPRSWLLSTAAVLAPTAALFTDSRRSGATSTLAIQTAADRSTGGIRRGQSPMVCLARPTTLGSGAKTTSGSLSA